MNKNKFIVLFFLFLPIFLHSEFIKAFWVAPWECDSREKVFDVINKAVEYKYTDIFVEVRYRANALYIPNKVNKDNYNPEPRYNNFPEDFDPLQIFIDEGHKYNLKIHAWVTTFAYKFNNSNAPHDFENYFTFNKDGVNIIHTNQKSIFFEPALEEVHLYLLNIFRDIAINYDIDGFHLDYIRFPDSNFGYHPESIKQFTEIYNVSPFENNYLFGLWRRDAISRFLRKFREEIKTIDSNIILSVAVMPNIYKAKDRFYQEWDYWDKENLIDLIVTMSYSDLTDVVERDIKITHKLIKNAKYVIGLKAWDDNDSLAFISENLKKNITSCFAYNLPGYSLFSYSWLAKHNNFLFNEINNLEK